MAALPSTLVQRGFGPHSLGFQTPSGTRHRDQHSTLYDIPADSLTEHVNSYQLPQQHALPLRSTQFRSSKGSQKPTPLPTQLDYENLLRRKTPGGTLTAAYDGTSVGSLENQHTTKYLLVPAASKFSTQRPASVIPVQGGVNASWGEDYRDAGERSESYPSRIQAAALVDEHTLLNFPSGSSRHSMPTDSALYQAQSHDVKFPEFQIPNMMQPSFRSQLGPAVSNEHGPYGPYWPNGTFVPYRPAAFEDPYFHSAHAECLPGHGSQVTLSPGVVRQNGVYNHHPQQWSPNGSNIVGNNATSFQNGNHFIPSGSPDVAQPNANRFHSNSSRILLQDSEPRGVYRHLPMNNDVYTQHLTEGAKNTNYDETYPDRVLAWAHSIYTNLVQSCRQARRSNSGRGSGQDLTSPLAIYPSPLRHDSQKCHSLHRHVSDPQNEYSSNATRSRKETYDSDRAADAIPSYNPLHSLDQRPQPNSATPYHDGRIQIDSNGRQSFQSMQTSEIQTSDNFTHHAQVGGPLNRVSHNSWTAVGCDSSSNKFGHANNAMNALKTMTELCSDSEWTWIEGMLLSGCLAYILGDHAQAVQLYSKILDRDATHVEALSNLAAALLALNRRAEAERYWRLAVHLRPSYFEAVEHLVGLLCYDNRNKEAAEIIHHVQRALRIARLPVTEETRQPNRASFAERQSHNASRMATGPTDNKNIDHGEYSPRSALAVHKMQGFGSSGYAISGTENGRILALVHAKGNILYNMQDRTGAAKAFEESVLIAVGHLDGGIDELIKKVVQVFSIDSNKHEESSLPTDKIKQPLLLPPEKALQTARLCFPGCSSLPGLRYIDSKISNRAALSVTSNALLSLAKIFQDGMSANGLGSETTKLTRGVQDILCLYYLSLSLHASPSTANNVGILLASAPGAARQDFHSNPPSSEISSIPGVIPGSGVALALAYYKYGLSLDPRHAHLFTNLGSLLKDIGQLSMAIQMYEQAVACDSTFDIALANLANAVKDQGRIGDAITYYKRAVQASPNFAEAVCGLANALNSVCNWAGRGGIIVGNGAYDRWHVNEDGMLADSQRPGAISSGWMKRVVDIVDSQLADGEQWGKDILKGDGIDALLAGLSAARVTTKEAASIRTMVEGWSSGIWIGAKVVRFVERFSRLLGWHWYRDKYIKKKNLPRSTYSRPKLLSSLNVPGAPTVLPFHTFTCPMSAKQIRMISQRNGLRVSCSVLRSSWLPPTVFPPPAPPSPYLRVGYVSSDFNNHPLAHLMQSVFGMHDRKRVKAFCYATTPSDRSVHRLQIENEAPVFYDASSWPIERLVQHIVDDGIHILVNLNGYTRGARNEVFAARPAPIQMSFMGFAGTLGAEWCDYLLADETAIPPSTLRPYRRSTNLTDLVSDDNVGSGNHDWVYSENIIYTRSTFFCCDHAQSGSPHEDPTAERKMIYQSELQRRWLMRKQIFPHLPDNAPILANFNQLYKIDPATFRSWLRILSRLPNAVLWLLRFPAVGEKHLRSFARAWAGEHVASRIIFTDVATKAVHIARAAAADLFIDTPECNAHTTAADCLWSGTPLLTWGRYEWKMCSRMGGGILKGALEWSNATPAREQEGATAWRELTARSETEYEERAIALVSGLEYGVGSDGVGRSTGRLADLRKLIWEGRWTAKLFDTRRWVRDVEDGYEEAWRRWVKGEGGDIWLKDLKPGG